MIEDTSEFPLSASALPLDPLDPGAKTLATYRFQTTYAALQALDALKVESDVEEVYCEHHEDYLVKKRNGRFHGIQVKTRIRGAAPWKAADEEIVGALARFVVHRLDLAEYFDGFTIATNHSFFTAARTAANLPHLLSLARDSVVSDYGASSALLDRFVGKLLRRLEKLLAASAGFPTLRDSVSRRRDSLGEGADARRVAIQTLARVDLRPGLGEIEGVEHVLRASVAVADTRFKTCSLTTLNDAASAIGWLTFLASSRHREDLSTSYVAVGGSPAAEALSFIEAKRLTADKIRRELDRVWAARGGVAAPAAAESSVEDSLPITLVLELKGTALKITASDGVAGPLRCAAVDIQGDRAGGDWDADPAAAGHDLCEHVFAPPVRALFDAERQAGGFRFRVRAEAAELRRLPWTCLIDPARGFVATGRDTPFVFLSETDYAAIRRDPAPRRFTIVYALACPRGLEPELQERVRVVYDDVRDALALAESRAAVDILPVDPCTPLRLFQALEKPADVVHIVAPAADGRILLEDETRGRLAVTPLELAQRLGVLQVAVFDLVHRQARPGLDPELFDSVHRLNGRVSIQCNAGVEKGAPGWQRVFYETLLGRREVDVALNAARDFLHTSNHPWHRLNGGLRRPEDFRLRQPSVAGPARHLAFAMSSLGRPARFGGPRESLMTASDVLLGKSPRRAVLFRGAAACGKTGAAAYLLWHLRGLLEGAWVWRCDSTHGFASCALDLAAHLERSALVPESPTVPSAGLDPGWFAEWLGHHVLRPRRFVIAFDGIERWLRKGSSRFRDRQLDDFIAALLEQTSGYGRLLFTSRRPFEVTVRSRRDHFEVFDVAAWQVIP